MAQKEYFPFANGPGRLITSLQWQRLASLWRPTGVVEDNYGNSSLRVSANGSGMVVYVEDGEALVQGEYLRLWDGPEALAVDAADTTHDRIDLVVVRLDRVNETMDLAVVKGTPSATPVAPSPIQGASIVEVPLAQVRVRAGTTVIESTDIQDRRVFSGIRPSMIAPQGSGSTLHADLLDGRHAMAGAFPGLVPVDRETITLDEGTTGWLTFATTSADGAASGFVLVEGGYGATGYATVEAIADVSGASRVSVKPGRPAAYLRAVRVVDGGTMLYLQIYAEVPNDGHGARTLTVYRYSMTGGGVPFWTLDTASPTTANVHAVVMLRNGAWRLTHALPGLGATIGWLDTTAKQSMFSFGASNNWSSSSYQYLLDGSTSTGGNPRWSVTANRWSYRYVTLIANAGAVLDGVKVNFYNAAGYWKAYLKIEASNDGNTWLYLTSHTSTQLGNARHTYVATVYFSSTAAKHWRFTFGTWASSGSSSTVTEIDMRMAASLLLRGVPTGCSVQLYDSGRNLLESRRNEAWSHDSPVLVGTSVANIAEIHITRPDGTTPWLEYPVWAVDGGALQNGDVLTLYAEL